ncbi:MAG: sigma-70 family RNA polymerase sigma factor [Eubacteriales bacterium]|nr:sigma-70 family RNA polymerase sigma factor [Eubacteriales bacterium]
MSDLAKLYTSEYMANVFYFCLRKTGNAYEAEDLTQDISMCVCSELRRGTEPANFSAWVWRIAKNRYSVWAERKHKKSDFVSGADIDDFEPADETAIENELIQNEDMSLLRRELAFISSDYRNIIVAFYIDDIKAKDIASRLNLPEGTVRSKLLRARKILKEGMGMARDFGKMSYKPEEVGFIMNGICGKYGEPWTIFNHKLSKNILLAAYRTPSAAEELAIELGVALPYMEDELEKMVAATLLRKNGVKYETNIFIVSADAQERIYANSREIAPELTQVLTALLEFEVKNNNEYSPRWNEGYQPYEDAKWALLMKLVDRVHFGVLREYEKQAGEQSPAGLGKWGHTLRPNGGEWDLLGLEAYTGDRPAFVGLHGCVDTPDYIADRESIDFGQFKFQYKNISDKTPMHISYEEAKALVAAANGDTSGIPQKVLDDLIGYGYLKKDEVYTPAFLVMKKSNLNPRATEQDAEHKRLYGEAVKIGFGHYTFCRDIIRAEIPDFFRDDRYQIDHACANIYEMRGAVLEEAIRTGYITWAENDDRKMLGAYLVI